MKFKMKVSAKEACRCAASLAMMAAVGVAIHFLWIKPTYEYLHYKLDKSRELLSIADSAFKGDKKAIQRIEQLTHEETGWVSYATLSTLYKKDAIDASGIKLLDQDVNLDLVNTSSMDELVLQAMREELDLDLYFVLRANRGKFDDEQKNRILEDAAALAPNVYNLIKIDVKSTFDQETKTTLLACYKKLEEKFHGPLGAILDMRSIGACSKNPPDGSFMKIAKALSTGEILSEEHVDHIEKQKP
jgi:hypothetical protein